MTPGDYVNYLKRDLEYLQGIADALDCKPLKTKLYAMRRNLNQFLDNPNIDFEANDDYTPEMEVE